MWSVERAAGVEPARRGLEGRPAAIARPLKSKRQLGWCPRLAQLWMMAKKMPIGDLRCQPTFCGVRHL